MPDLKSLVASATAAYRDVKIALDGARVFEREQLLLRIAEAKRRATDLERQRRQAAERDDPDARLSRPDEALVAQDAEIDALQNELRDLLDRVAELEQQMRDAEVTFRFTALPKHTFEALRAEGAGDAAKVYSLIARASGQHLNGDQLEDIPSEVWDDLEEHLTAGQWSVIAEALDIINVLEGKQGLGFLSASAPIRTSAQI